MQLLSDKLERYIEEDTGRREQDSDWLKFLRRYVKVTAIYGVLMIGVTLLGRFVLQPLLTRTLPDQRFTAPLCVVFCVLGIALFVRPMLDLHSTEYTTLWVKNRYFKLPLISLTALRYLLIVLIAFFPIQALLNVSGVWLLPVIAAAVAVIARTGWLSSAYISAEAQFMANFNERNLQRDDENTEWLDEKLFVDELDCPAEIAGKTMKQLDWGHRFSVNVIRVLRGKRHLNMPSGHVELKAGDRLLVIGKREDLRALRLSLSQSENTEPPTLRAFTEAQEGDGAHLYATVIPVDKVAELQGKSIRTSGLREKYDCMILGLQRNRLPILQPDVNMTIQRDDLVWVLGTRKMAAKLLAGGFSEE